MTLRSQKSLAVRQEEMRRRQPPRRGRGRPRLAIRGEMVRALAECGERVSYIAWVLHCSEPTIRRRFATEYKQGELVFQAKVQEAAFRVALIDRDPRLLIFLLVSRGVLPKPKPLLYRRRQAPRRAKTPDEVGVRPKASGRHKQFPRLFGGSRQPYHKRTPEQRRAAQQAQQQKAQPSPPALPAAPVEVSPPPRRPWFIGEFFL